MKVHFEDSSEKLNQKPGEIRTKGILSIAIKKSSVPKQEISNEFTDNSSRNVAKVNKLETNYPNTVINIPHGAYPYNIISEGKSANLHKSSQIHHLSTRSHYTKNSPTATSNLTNKFQISENTQSNENKLINILNSRNTLSKSPEPTIQSPSKLWTDDPLVPIEDILKSLNAPLPQKSPICPKVYTKIKKTDRKNANVSPIFMNEFKSKNNGHPALHNTANNWINIVTGYSTTYPKHKSVNEVTNNKCKIIRNKRNSEKRSVMLMGRKSSIRRLKNGDENMLEKSVNSKDFINDADLNLAENKQKHKRKRFLKTNILELTEDRSKSTDLVKASPHNVFIPNELLNTQEKTKIKIYEDPETGKILPPYITPKKTKWYDHRERLIFNQYYRRNFNPFDLDASGHKHRVAKLRVGDLWKSASKKHKHKQSGFPTDSNTQTGLAMGREMFGNWSLRKLIALNEYQQQEDTGLKSPELGNLIMKKHFITENDENFDGALYKALLQEQLKEEIKEIAKNSKMEKLRSFRKAQLFRMNKSCEKYGKINKRTESNY